MYLSTLLPGLLCAVTVSAMLIPPPLLKRDTVYRVEATYYEGTSVNGTCGEEAVSSGFINSGECKQLYTSGISMDPLGSRSCEYILFKGTTTCDRTASSVERTNLPAGGQSVCIDTTVLDGGAHTPVSGILRCGTNVNTVRPRTDGIVQRRNADAAAKSSSKTVTSTPPPSSSPPPPPPPSSSGKSAPPASKSAVPSKSA